MYQLITLPDDFNGETASFYDGAVLAANFATKPLEPQAWLPEINGDEIEKQLVNQINLQYAAIKSSQYTPSDWVLEKDTFADFSEGFMTVWPKVEELWQEVNVTDGTLRMLQALLTTFMLGMNEEKTQSQMKEAGIDSPPSLQDLLPQLDLMISEVAMAADEAMIGAKSQMVNPYKTVSRNDPCPCGNGKKFKQCCGR